MFIYYDFDNNLKNKKFLSFRYISAKFDNRIKKVYNLIMKTSRTLSEFHIRSREGISAMLHFRPYPLMHDHVYHELNLQTEGSVLHCFQDGSQELIKAGDLILIAPHLTHSYRDSGEVCEYINLPIQTKLFNTISDFLKIPRLEQFLKQRELMLKVTLSNADLVAFKKTFSSIELSDASDEDKTLRYKFFLIDLLKQFVHTPADSAVGGKTSYPDWLQTFILRLQNPEMFLMPLDQIVSSTGYSHSHLCKLFKKYTGHTLQNYIIALKMQYAARMLTESDYPISYIATEIGYSTQGHFTKVFESNFFESPNGYRKKYTKKRT